MTTKIKVITTEKDYQEALNLIEELMSKNPEPESEDGEKLNLLVTLVKDYESKLLPESLPDPIDAIEFRMEQQNLKPVDLVPYIGSRGKVSEILSRKRPLTLSMIRSLEAGLGIPAKVLLRESDEFRDPDNIAWKKVTLQEMQKRGYFGNKSINDSNIKALIKIFFSPIGSPSYAFGMLRKSNYIRASRAMDRQALAIWSGYIAKKAKEIVYKNVYKPGLINLEFMKKVAQLSAESEGVIKVIDLLKENGIGLIIEPHFPKTYLDGIAILTDKKHPIIGLTIRHDRLDSFWFTLMHELAHISLHSDKHINLFYDDLDSEDSNTMEREADQLAREVLVPESKWENSPARLIPSPIAAESLAKELKIHPAIVAGKMRYEGQNYQYLNKIVGEAKIRKYFTDIKWDK